MQPYNKITHTTDTYPKVKQANRSELFRLLIFLDNLLPNYAEVHSIVLSTLFTANPSYSVFFSQSDSGKTYSAIVGIKKELSCLPTRQSKEVFQAFISHHFMTGVVYCLIRFFIVSGWGVDEMALRGVYSIIEDVNWKEDAFVISYDDHVIHPSVFGLAAFRKSDCFKHYKGMGRYVYDISEALRLQLSFPDSVYVKSLERCHAKTVFDHWDYSYTTSLEEVADEIDELPSAGLFLKGSDQLVSWVMSHQPNGMSRLHTLTEHRKQGYASLVILYMAKRLAQAGYVPFANVEKTNTNSRQLFEKIGFRFLHVTNQLFLLSSTKNP